MQPTHAAAGPAPLALVFGASGYIGTNLVPRLRAHGFRVRAAARNPDPLEARDWPGVERIAADALDPSSLPAALAGVDVAFYLVHSMAAGRDFGRLDVEAAGHFARAAEAAGIRRIVYLGGLIPPDARSEHLLSRRASGDALRRGAVPVTEIRAGIIVGPGSAAWEVIRDLVYHLPLMLTPRWVRCRSSPIALDDLLEDLVGVARLPAAAGRIFDVGGPDYISYQSMMREFAALVGKRPWIVPVPVLTPEMSAYWLALVTAVPAPIARALIGGLRHDLPADDAPLRALLPRRLRGFRDAAQAALDAEREHTVAARWTEGAFAFRGRRPDHAFYAKRASGEAVSTASPAALWSVLLTMGGANAYFYGKALWRIREGADWLLGGPGLVRGRRHPTDLRIGDTIDWWTVMGVEPGRRLTLHFGLKAPGSGALEYEIEPAGGGAQRIRVTAYWHPRGFWGLLYWHAFAPAHAWLFAGMTREIARRAEALAREPT
ncbi:MAG: SDR family oxidoreductase [Xanthomonadaceae bacterium]|jgi:uncharacterized protein YbjT (DUF2867 family)|nr:SDR family oxidoreductase [Xanthomonadaceae bacterium]